MNDCELPYQVESSKKAYWIICATLVFGLPPLTGGIFIPVENMPIDFVIMRASSIPTLVTDVRSMLKVGFTGSDIIWESGFGKDSGEELPVYWLNPNVKQSSLYIGITNELAQDIEKRNIRRPSIEDLEGYMVATKYPNIARQVFAEREMNNVEIFPIPGTDEAMQYVYPNCYGVLGIKNSGLTSGSNGIEVLDIFYKITVRSIKAAEKLRRSDEEILDDLKLKIAYAIQIRKHDVY